MGEQHKHPLPEEKFDEHKQVFDLFDRDGDGRIDISELGTVLRAAGRMPTEAELKTLRTELSVDATRSSPAATFTFADLLSTIAKLPVVDPVALRVSLLDAFRVFDHAGSGEIGTQELQHIMTSLGEKLTEEEAAELVKLADPSNSGSIRYATLVDRLVSST